MTQKNPLRVITLHRPWAWAVAHLGKDIENRTWVCPIQPGQPLAIHAGKKWDADGADWIMRQGFSLPPKDDHPNGIVAIATFQGNFEASDSRWFFGPVGWALTDVVAIAPIDCKGQQGLWTVKEPLLSQVREAYKLAKNGGAV